MQRYYVYMWIVFFLTLNSCLFSVHAEFTVLRNFAAKRDDEKMVKVDDELWMTEVFSFDKLAYLKGDRMNHTADETDIKGILFFLNISSLFRK